MGLGLVELVLIVEEEFGVDIPADIAETITTPRKLMNYITNHPEVKKKQLSKELIEEKIWTMIENELGVVRSDYNDDSRFIEDMGVS